MNAWQPMSTAPKHGGKFLIWCGPTGKCGLCFWSERKETEKYIEKAHWHSINEFGNSMNVEPTHWMPLPSPPEDK